VRDGTDRDRIRLPAKILLQLVYHFSERLFIMKPGLKFDNCLALHLAAGDRDVTCKPRPVGGGLHLGLKLSNTKFED
jgi:hypothetical protein